MPTSVFGNSIIVDVRTNGSLEASVLIDDKQVRYATALAINRTAEAVNAEAGRQIQQRMTVRVPRFILPPTTLPTKWRATRERLIAMVRLGDDTPIGTRRRQILDPFEQGEEKQGSLAGPIAIPTKALRPTKASIVPRNMFPKYLGLVARRDNRARGGFRNPKTRTLASGAQAIIGKRGTFILDPSVHPGLKPEAWGVYQRTGPGKHDVRMIWAFRQHVRIPDLLDIEEAAARIVPAEFETNFRWFFDFALRTAKR